MVQINFNAGENTGGGWEPLPEGNQIFEIQSLDVGVSKAQNPQIELSMLIVGGPRDGGNTKNWYSLMPKAGWNLRGLLDALGIEYTIGGADSEGRDDLSFDGDELIGRRVEYYVKQREWQGKLNNDFTNPKDPDYVEDQEQAAAGAAAPAPAPAPAAAAPAATGGARRRPRPAR